MGLGEFKRAGHWPTLVCSFLYFDTSFMAWTLMGALGVFIAQAFHLSPAQKGLLVAIPLLGGAILRIILGIATDHFGPRKTGLAGLSLTLVPLLWGWLHSSSTTDLVGIGLLLGVAGASFAVALPLASRWYPPHFQGLALGIAGAGNSGTVFGAFFAPHLAEHYGWRAVFGLAAIPIAFILLVFWLVAKEAPDRPAAKSLKNYLDLLKEPDTWWFNGFYMVTFGGFVGLASFLPIFFFDQYGVTRVQAGTFAALCVFAGSLLRPLGGWMADRVGGIRVLSFLYVMIAFLLCALSSLPTLPIAITLLFLTMACLGTGNGSVFQLVPQRFGKEIGVATGVVGAAGGLGGFFLPTLLGSLKSLEGSYAAGLLAFALVVVGAAFALARVKHSWRADWARADLDVAF
ncbi:MAG TPA: nitrate/nitrite transporter [Candidatus Binataceae bacterium]|nr:nitrate/nitrite transporter [Candidatus Binataceae bacterium]